MHTLVRAVREKLDSAESMDDIKKLGIALEKLASATRFKYMALEFVAEEPDKAAKAAEAYAKVLDSMGPSLILL